MQVILQGNLRQFPPQELLSFLLSRGHRGTLDFEVEGKRTRVLFESDKIVWAEASGGSRGADAVIETLEWTGGNFMLLDEAALPEGVAPLNLELPALVEEMRRRVAERNAGFADATTFRVVEDPALQQQISLTADEFKVLFRVGGGRTFRELLADMPTARKEVAERLKHLNSLGLVSIEEPGEATRRERPAPEEAGVSESPAGELTQVQSRTALAREPEPQAAPQQSAPQQSVPQPAAPQQPAPQPSAPQPAAEQSAPQAPAPQPTAPPEPPAEPKHTLVGSLTRDDAPDNIYPLLDDQCTIGRAADNSIAIADGSVSSNHARITRTDDGFFLEDLGSRNGSFVNGDKITAKRQLADGDLIRLGKIVLTFNIAKENRMRSATTQAALR
ncbi:MAG TPA: FHA domain-containing protein [Thermoanaerobaculia bacterium]|jgi:hypothetical protein